MVDDFIWWHFIPKLEPISNEMAETQPRSLHVQARAAPRQKIRPLNYPMKFPPPIFNFLAERDGFSGEIFYYARVLSFVWINFATWSYISLSRYLGDLLVRG